MLLFYLLAFFIPFTLVLLLTPLAAKWAVKLDFTDKPTERKKHAVPIPLAGGVVMFASLAPGFIFLAARTDKRLFLVFFGALLLLGIGMLDDYYKTQGRDFSVAPRMLTHIAAATLAFAAGVRFTGFFNPLTDHYILFSLPLQFVMTVLWIIGLISAINFMDGLDGLAGGLCGISGFTFFIVALLKDQPDSACMALLLIGAVAGFLRYNLPPPRIYMGDSGAYLLGYLLAVISLFGAFKQATLISIFVPVLAMGVPIFDSLLVVFRRVHAKKPAYEADADDITHLHYRLLKTGMKPTHAVAFIFLLSACLNLASIVIILIVG
jgi:UDP-N-acetylmuramyl pentapeptide phosphotransferase/UDP-N-acetylglucosamine-1-phosphate transferase